MKIFFTSICTTRRDNQVVVYCLNAVGSCECDVSRKLLYKRMFFSHFEGTSWCPLKIFLGCAAEWLTLWHLWLAFQCGILFLPWDILELTLGCMCAAGMADCTGEAMLLLKVWANSIVSTIRKSPLCSLCAFWHALLELKPYASLHLIQYVQRRSFPVAGIFARKAFFGNYLLCFSLRLC